VARLGLVPVERRELEERVFRPLRQEAEDVAEIRPGLDGEELAAREERREECVDGAGVVAADEEATAELSEDLRRSERVAVSLRDPPSDNARPPRANRLGDR
jgi:hypothetical protein